MAKKTTKKAKTTTAKAKPAPSLDDLAEDPKNEEPPPPPPPEPPVESGASAAVRGKPKVGRFAHTQFSAKASSISGSARTLCQGLEKHLESELPESREREKALTHLESCLMWVNKACREV